jgi:hypothetical protein
MKGCLSLLVALSIGLGVSSRNSFQVSHADPGPVLRVISELERQVREREKWKLILNEREIPFQDRLEIQDRHAEFEGSDLAMRFTQGGVNSEDKDSQDNALDHLSSIPHYSLRPDGNRRAYRPDLATCSCPDACQVFTAERGRIRDGFRPHCPRFKAGGLYPNGLDDCWYYHIPSEKNIQKR